MDPPPPEGLDWPSICRAIRTAHRWSSREFARHLRVAPSTVCAWENGRAKPRGFKRKDVEALFFETGDSTPLVVDPTLPVLTSLAPGDLRAIVDVEGFGFRHIPTGIIVHAATWSLVVEKLWLARLAFAYARRLPLPLAVPALTS
jgi:transcriptional regulator with XRE-family HTH domain